MLKLIQLGLTFTDAEGQLPRINGELCVWQFNFRWALGRACTPARAQLRACCCARGWRQRGAWQRGARLRNAIQEQWRALAACLAVLCAQPSPTRLHLLLDPPTYPHARPQKVPPVG